MKQRILDFAVLIEQDEEGMFIARIPDIQGCSTQGKTVEQAMERAREAIQVCIEADRMNIQPMKFVGVQRIEMMA